MRTKASYVGTFALLLCFAVAALIALSLVVSLWRQAGEEARREVHAELSEVPV